MESAAYLEEIGMLNNTELRQAVLDAADQLDRVEIGPSFSLLLRVLPTADQRAEHVNALVAATFALAQAKVTLRMVTACLSSDGSKQVVDEPPPGGGGGGGSGLVRTTVNLTPRAYADLQRLSEDLRLSRTDVVNRAIQVCALIERLIKESGGHLTVLDAEETTRKIYIV